MNLNIQIDDRELRAAFAKAPTKVASGINVWIKRAALLTEDEAKRQVPPSIFTGRMQSSIHTSFGRNSATVKPTSKYAYWVHEGRKPNRRMPPFGPGTDLNAWATRKGMNPFLVARSIGRKGTKGNPFMDKAYRSVKPRVEREAQIILGEIVRGI